MESRQSSYSNILKQLVWKRRLFYKSQYIFSSYDEIKDKADIFTDSKTLWFFAGELFYGFYNDQRILGALSTALKQGAKIQCIFGPALYVNNVNFFNMALNHENVTLYKRALRDDSHFKIIERLDGRILAISDERHDIDVEDKYRRSVLLLNGYSGDIRKMTDKFVEQRAEAKLITRDNILEEFSDPKINEKGHKCGFIFKKDGVTHLADKSQIDSFAEQLGLSSGARAVPRKYKKLIALNNQ